MRNLVWRATKNSLPTKTNLVQRKIITSSTCESCQQANEDVCHALFHCPKLSDLWNKVPLWNHDSLRQAATFIDLTGCVFADNRDPALFSMVIWTLWNRRNNLRLRKAVISLDQVLHQAKERLREFALHNTVHTIPVRRQPTRWLPPDRPLYKLNFDGALFAAEQCAGLGVILRNSEGQAMVSLTERATLPFTAIEVEAMAARRALLLALETGFDRVILEGDSQVLITALQNNSYTLSHFGHLVQDIQYLASCFSEIHYSHVRRHCNTVAHALAKRANSISHYQVWMEDVPPDITSVLEADFIGLTD